MAEEEVEVTAVQVTVTPNPEPVPEPFDRHIGPLDDDEDGRFLEENDPRRIEAEARRGRRFVED
jgi:hypothetical protein